MTVILYPAAFAWALADDAWTLLVATSWRIRSCLPPWRGRHRVPRGQVSWYTQVQAARAARTAETAAIREATAERAVVAPRRWYDAEPQTRPMYPAYDRYAPLAALAREYAADRWAVAEVGDEWLPSQDLVGAR